VAISEELSNQIPDRQALAEYQSRLSDANFERDEGGRLPAVAEMLPNQIPDRQALAEYQAGLSDGNIRQINGRKCIVAEMLPGEISDRQALAEYQAHLGDGNLCQPVTLRTLSDFKRQVEADLPLKCLNPIFGYHSASLIILTFKPI